MNFLKKFKFSIKFKKHFQLAFLVFLFLFSLFLRTYQFRGRTAFSTDQGRDFLKVWQHVKEKKLYFLGPKASVGDFYMPPFYYYLITPAIVLGGFNPLSGGFFNALVESFTPLVVFMFCKKFFNKKSAIIGGLLYAVSPLVIDFATFLWNPNTIPFFVSLILFFLFSYLKDKNGKSKDVKKGREKDFIIATILYCFAFQLHYQMVIIGFFFLFVFLLKPLKKVKSYLVIIFSFLISHGLYFYYELTHDFYNLRGIYAFFTQEHSFYYHRVRKLDFIVTFLPRFFGQVVGANSLILGRLMFVLSIIGLIIIFYFFVWKLSKKKKEIKHFFYNSLFLWLVFIGLDLLGLRIYKGDKLGYYLSFMFVVPIVSLAIVLSRIKLKFFKIDLIYLLTVFILLLNLKTGSVFKKPGRSLEEKEKLAEKILELTEGKPYALEIPSRLYNAPVRYLLAYQDKEPVDSSQAEIAIKVCYHEKNCSSSYFEDEKRGMPKQVMEKINYHFFSQEEKEEINYKELYIYILKKAI